MPKVVRDLRLKQQQQVFYVLIFATTLLVVTLEIFSTSFTTTSTSPAYATKRTFMSANFQGRTGNLMFIYASLLGIAKRNNVTAIIPQDLQLLEIFRLSVNTSQDIDNSLINHKDYEEFGKRCCAYDIRTEHLLQNQLIKQVELHGYYQSWRYFENIHQELLSKQFQFNSDIKLEAEMFHYEVRQRFKADVHIGVHVRRGDMNSEYHFNYGYSLPGKDYFEKAMRIMLHRFKSAVFIVCSDELSWAKENIQGTNVVFSTHSANVDLAILSLSDHVIMSVGSFSWWAAYLANGFTVYYSNWPRPVSQLEYRTTKKDYFPPDWLGIDERTNINKYLT